VVERNRIIAVERDRIMMIAEYLRHQVDNCLRIGRSAFDLATAERLRYMAAELQAKAHEIEDDDKTPEPSMMGQHSGRNHN